MRKIGVTPNVPERQFGQGSVFTRLFTISVNLVPAIPKLRAPISRTSCFCASLRRMTRPTPNAPERQFPKTQIYTCVVVISANWVPANTKLRAPISKRGWAPICQTRVKHTGKPLKRCEAPATSLLNAAPTGRAGWCEIYCCIAPEHFGAQLGARGFP